MRGPEAEPGSAAGAAPAGGNAGMCQVIGVGAGSHFPDMANQNLSQTCHMYLFPIISRLCVVKSTVFMPCFQNPRSFVIGGFEKRGILGAYLLKSIVAQRLVVGRGWRGADFA